MLQEPSCCSVNFICKEQQGNETVANDTCTDDDYNDDDIENQDVDKSEARTSKDLQKMIPGGRKDRAEI